MQKRVFIILVAIMAVIGLCMSAGAAEPVATVTYNSNNGTGMTDSVDVEIGSQHTIVSNVFTYGKCKIESWNTQADGMGYSYFDGEDFTVTEDITLYAQWVLPLNNYDSFSDEDYEWSGNDSAPYTFAMKNSAVLYASVVFPSKDAGEKVILTVDGDCEIKGRISFERETGMSYSSYSSDFTICGDGSLEFYELKATGSGDTFTVETDVVILSEYMFIGASGGADSKLVIKDAALTVHDLTLLETLVMEGEAELSVLNGTASFASGPQISLSDESVIYIEGLGTEYGYVLYHERTDDTEAFDALKDEGWLPEGYSFGEYGGNYYLYDADGNIETDPVTIRKAKSDYTITYVTDGGMILGDYVTTYQSDVGATLPTFVIASGYTFRGWYDNPDFEGDVIKKIEKGETGDKTFYAKWTKKSSGGSGTSHKCTVCKVCDGCLDLDCNMSVCRDKCIELTMAFTDVAEDAWYAESVKFVYHHDIMKGVSETKFDVDGSTTRAMIVTTLWRLEGEPVVNYYMTFKDVAQDTWYSDAVRWAASEGVVLGYSAEEFRPDTPITREQMAAMIYRYAEYKGVAPTGAWAIRMDYADLAKIAEYASEGVMYCTLKTLMQGRENGKFEPQANATRAEIAVVLHRFIVNNK